MGICIAGSNFPFLIATSFVLRMKHMADLKINERLQESLCESHAVYGNFFRNCMKIDIFCKSTKIA